jgi:hypothetical protein
MQVMDNLDKKFQLAVDRLANELLGPDVFATGDYGAVDKDGVKVRWWRYYKDDCVHLVFIASRKLPLVFYKKFINGVVVQADGTRRLMTSDEVGDYD